MKTDCDFRDGYVSSMLLGVEAIRACARGARRRILVAAPEVRALDALHLATALSVRDEIGAFFTYDARLGEAAAEHGLPVCRLL